MSYASTLEVICHLTIADHLRYINKEDYSSLRRDFDIISNKLNSLYKHQINYEKTLKSKERRN